MDLARHCKPIGKTNSHILDDLDLCRQQNDSGSHTSNLDYREFKLYNGNVTHGNIEGNSK